MTHRPERKSIPLQELSARCPEAQADGVPCTELGRNCEECERAIATRARDFPDQDSGRPPDTWTV